MQQEIGPRVSQTQGRTNCNASHGQLHNSVENTEAGESRSRACC